MTWSWQLEKQLNTAEGRQTLAFSAALRSGETLALFGPSGRGKTSVLRMLAGLLTPDQGIVRQHDRLLFDSSQGINLPPQKRRIAYLFQDYALMPHLTVRENLRFAQRQANPARIDELLEIMQLGNLQQLFPRQLSGGQQQRVALARCFVEPADLFLLDEPLNALDSALRLRLMHWMSQQLRQWQAQTLVVTHDLAEVFFLATHVAHFDVDGVRLCRPDELLPRPNTPGRFAVAGQIVRLEPFALNTRVSVAIGQDVISTLVDAARASSLQLGQKVQLFVNGSSVVIG